MIETTRFTLSNGLRVIHNYDSAAAMVALDVLYNVGGRDESPDLTGMAHLFEHLMFGGSVNIPDFDGAIERAGGTNNAWTSNDFTNFYDIVPAHNVETAFWLESDRMLGLAFSDKALEVQRHVVMEEFKQVCLNQPYGDLFHHLRSLVYTSHPYRYPVIGKELGHIERVTQEDIRRFFYSHYAPNNAVLAVSGNITADETRRLAEKWFDPIPSREVSPRLYLPEPPQTAPRRMEVSGNVPQTLIVKAYRMPGYANPDYAACDLITDLLALGRSSRFYRHLLMETELFSDVDASIEGSEEPGTLMLTGHLRPGADIIEAEEAIVRETRRLTDGSLTRRELEGVVNRFEARTLINSMGYRAKAELMAVAEMHGEDVNDTLPRYRAVTCDDIVRVTSGIVTPDNCSTLIYRPE
ncbi:MAG: insulinase family protein [Pseudoflavonifractor sp.]|nr:insulinase family protein [Pseudoflavonifractor sp.]